MDLKTNLRQDLQALIGPEEEWPDEVREYVAWCGRLCGAMEKAHVNYADAALLAVANARGTCSDCQWLEPYPDHDPWCGCYVVWPPETDWTDFGCSLFERKDTP